jgi:hypothetical protein
MTVFISNDRPTDWPTHEFRYRRSNRDVMPPFTAVCRGTQWMAVRRNSIAENFGSRIFKGAQWEGRDVTVLLKNKLPFFRTSVGSTLSSTSTSRNADMGSLLRKKDIIFSLVSRTLNFRPWNGQTRTITSTFLLSDHCLGRFANCVSWGKEYGLRVHTLSKQQTLTGNKFYVLLTVHLEICV